MFDGLFGPENDDITDWMDDEIAGASDVDGFMRDVAAIMAEDFGND
jgi:hypothetical protein